MKRTLKILKILLLVILMLAIVGGAFYLLLFMDIIKTPAFLSKAPVINKYLPNHTPENKETELEKISKENDKLTSSLVDKDKKIQKLQETVSDFKKKQKGYEQIETKLKEDIANMNEQMVNLKVNQKSQGATYKDMATYFTEMKAKDAADILSRLDDKDIIGILNEMEKGTAADLLQKMDRNKAAGITKKMLVTTP